MGTCVFVCMCAGFLMRSICRMSLSCVCVCEREREKESERESAFVFLMKCICVMSLSCLHIYTHILEELPGVVE